MATPRTTGLRPIPLDFPAFTQGTFLYEELETLPEVARHWLDTVKSHPDLDFKVDFPLS
jgi:hypothetical protein